MFCGRGVLGGRAGWVAGRLAEEPGLGRAAPLEWESAVRSTSNTSGPYSWVWFIEFLVLGAWNECSVSGVGFGSVFLKIYQLGTQLHSCWGILIFLNWYSIVDWSRLGIKPRALCLLSQ